MSVFGIDVIRRGMYVYNYKSLKCLVFAYMYNFCYREGGTWEMGDGMEALISMRHWYFINIFLVSFYN